MNKYIVQYLTQEYGSLDDRETVVEAASAADAKRKVESATRHAYYAEIIEASTHSRAMREGE